MAVLEPEIKGQLKEMLAGMEDDVELVLVKQVNPYTNDIESLVNEIAGLSEKLSVKAVNISDEIKKKYGIAHGPAILIRSANVKGKVVYFGLPGGYEFGAFAEAIRLAGTKSQKHSKIVSEFASGLEKPLELKVFVTPGCPHCPPSALLAYRLGMLSAKVTALVYEAGEFPDESAKFKVSGVPHTVINNGEGEYIGGYPEETAIAEIKKVVG